MNKTVQCSYDFKFGKIEIRRTFLVGVPIFTPPFLFTPIYGTV